MPVRDSAGGLDLRRLFHPHDAAAVGAAGDSTLAVAGAKLSEGGRDERR